MTQAAYNVIDEYQFLALEIVHVFHTLKVVLEHFFKKNLKLFMSCLLIFKAIVIFVHTWIFLKAAIGSSFQLETAYFTSNQNLDFIKKLFTVHFHIIFKRKTYQILLIHI